MLGLICPPFITKLDFKSKEELQSMPQTEEEHLENQNLDYEDLDKAHPDAEVTNLFFIVTFKYLKMNNDIWPQKKLENFTSDKDIMLDRPVLSAK